MWDLVLFDSCNDVASGKILAFAFGFPGGKLGKKTNQNHHFWICLVSAKTLNFETLFGDCLCLIKDYLWSKFQQI